MNKDVIYIEPEDDITDIIGKIEGSKEKIIALVPPKKAGVLRSIVNVKLIAKSATNAGKTVVLVTIDPSIVKLAAATKLPVTKNLQSAPVVPVADEAELEKKVVKEEVKERTGEDDEEEIIIERNEEDLSETDEATDGTMEESRADEDEKTDKKSRKKVAKEKKNQEEDESKNPAIRWMTKHKKLLIFGGMGLVILIVVAVWAFAIAPAATITVGIRTTTSNFSENVTFTDKLAEEDVSAGKFYLKSEKIEEKTEGKFKATGTKNVGEKATGEVIAYVYFPISGDGGSVAINAGSRFRIGELVFISNADSVISWDGDLGSLSTDCENYNQASLKVSGCLVSNKIPVTAENPGESYNISASFPGWSTTANVSGVYSDSAMTGGTDKIVTIVQQSDVDEALSKLSTSSEEANKKKLLESVNESDFAIESSFKQVTGEPVVSPKVGEEVKEGEQASLTVVTTATIFVVDKTKIEEFIAEKAKIAESYKIYSINDPFVENFTQVESGYVGKLKTSYVSGPKVTENDVVEIVKGKGLGVAQHDLKDIDGISSIRIDTSYPWVMSIPNDPNKITVILEVEDQK